MDDPDFALIARIIAKSGKKTIVRNALIDMVKPTKKENGCILYNLHVEEEKPNSFYLYEIWDCRESFDKHTQTAHFKNLLDIIQPITEKLKVVFLRQQHV